MVVDTNLPTKPMPNPSCATCRFWRAFDYTHAVVMPAFPRGECMRRAPVPDSESHGRFPSVSSRDWCGEHEYPPGCPQFGEIKIHDKPVDVSDNGDLANGFRRYLCNACGQTFIVNLPASERTAQ